MTRARRGKRRLHATDIDTSTRPGQKTVTAMCGARVAPDRAVYYRTRVLLQPLTCPGCRAIIIERMREYFSQPSMARS